MLNKSRVWSLDFFLVGLRTYQHPCIDRLLSLLVLQLTRHGNWRVCCAVLNIISRTDHYWFTRSIHSVTRLTACVWAKHRAATDSVHMSETLGRDWQRAYERNTGPRSRNRFYSGKTKVLHILCVCLYPELYSMHRACAVLYCRLCLVRMYRVSASVINGKILRGGGYWKQNACFDFLYNFCLKHFSF